MEKEFRLYSRFRSNFFHLIEGALEPQQTKGLGLLLSKSETALKLFIKLMQSKYPTLTIDLRKVDRMIVDCELPSSGKPRYRADIVMRLYANDKPLHAFLIEAKSIGKGGSSSEGAYKQVENYQDRDAFAELREFADKVHFVILTKYGNFTAAVNSISITWNDLINTFHPSAQSGKDELLTDYLNFITNITNSMKFYEQEVFSIPAGVSHDTVKATFVYERPATYKSFQKPLYLAFRKSGGGEMECLYSIEEIIELDFSSNYHDFLRSEQYPIPVKQKIEKYVAAAKWETKGFPTDKKQVFVLSDKVIRFMQPYPRPEKNQAFTAYYSLADMFDEEHKLRL